jgi:hypothetical protein
MGRQVVRAGAFRDRNVTAAADSEPLEEGFEVEGKEEG